MDQYSVQFTGFSIDADKLMSVFFNIKIQKYNRRGEDFNVVNDVNKQSVREGNFASASITFLYDGLKLLTFLEIIVRKWPHVNCEGIDETVVWCLMERNGQINGELKAAELGMLSKVNAHFCWSVL